MVRAEGGAGREGGEEVREAAEGAGECVVGEVVGGGGDVVAAWMGERVRYGGLEGREGQVRCVGILRGGGLVGFGMR